jgi:hypothetical protein
MAGSSAISIMPSVFGLMTERLLSSTTTARFASPHSEFSVVDDENTDEENDETSNQIKISKDLFIVNEDAQYEQERHQHRRLHDQHGSSTQQNNNKAPFEYGALRPGTTVRIQVGDLALARKAWKKRRRSGSPLLVPCSILDVDRKSMVRWNLLFLLEKFGQSTKRGIEISVAGLARTYRSCLQSSLERQAHVLGYKSKNEMLQDMFNQKVQESYGVRLIEKPIDNIAETNSDNKHIERYDSMLYLEAPISHMKGQARTKNTPLLQFRLSTQDGMDEKQDIEIEADALMHTGYVRALKDPSVVDEIDSQEQQQRQTDDQTSSHREYTFLPLSAALRVSQKDEMETSLVEQGRVCTAVVFDYAKIGDGGSPLLTLSLNPGGTRESLKIKPDKRYRTNQSIQKPKSMLKDLKVGDGPYRAKVVKVIKGRALVDLNVGKEQAYSDTTANVLGSLHFRDAVVPDTEGDPVLVPMPKSQQITSFMDFTDDEINGDDDEDLEYLIAASIDDLDVLDDDEDDDDDDYDIDAMDDTDVIDEDDEDSDEIVDDVLALRSEDSFDEGTFEEGEVEEDISHLFQMDENGNLLYNDPDTNSVTIIEEGSNVDFIDQIDDDVEVDEPINSDDEENIADETISQLFTENDDGSITYHDPETGETMIVDETDPTYKDLKVMKSLIDDQIPSSHTPPSSRRGAAPRKGAAPSRSSKSPRFVPKILKEGDVVDVYILSVSKQSQQFKVTTNPLIQGREAKELKKEGDARKKMQRLKRSLGGSLKTINRLTNLGTELNGVVKATSKNWIYVQPESEASLPVGIATLEEDLAGIVTGDNVRIKVTGIDEERGQLALKVISKVSP